ncbi:NADH dehydrogenase [ubiquinone] iron-sulfur protein 4, mitochondrial [Tetrabaena socialis]|uniref:NADH dehydrogenase [ubiquinone] iron-sulfur protein 4, mitochondrial n=1 Tax=Tetrabaena socialis TaxID=47790 RepID=A0A2J7ZNQ1_9CHLO|nr:NADH dehydrogenase [ubiquinone] iron-sulfur protein 4, mitochondrial [Tetrabaena socialis]|eukprot:PNH01903.1 NADH dehydrogenase [ubiquinone] iron-sulfur protein 4, mitochondrial [Tetrabaena socialis]
MTLPREGLCGAGLRGVSTKGGAEGSAAPPAGGTSSPSPDALPAGPEDYSIVLRLAKKLAVPPGDPASPGEVARLSGVPQPPRRVLILSAARSPEQQGRQRTGFNRSFPAWSVEFLDPVFRWINPLMGWTSTSDTMHQSAVALNFYSAEEAAAFCERQGWSYEIAEPQQPKEGRGRRWATYGDNFSVRRHGFPDLTHLPSNSNARGGEDGGGAGQQRQQQQQQAESPGVKAEGSN